MKTMKVEILRGVIVDGKPAAAGDVVEVTAADGNLLIGAGKAQAVGAAAVEPEPAVEAPKKSRRSTATED